MRLQTPWNQSWWLLKVVMLMALTWTVVAEEVAISKTGFDNLPRKVHYFDDSENMLYHDGASKTVYWSGDEGKTWKKPEGIPEGNVRMMVDHSFSKQVAFIITESTTHYITRDQGKSWQTFTVPLDPAFGTGVLAFNSHREEYVIYHGLKCTGSWGWGKSCHVEAFYTENGFQSEPKKLADYVVKCIWTHASKDFDLAPVQQIFCIISESRSDQISVPLSDTRLVTTQNFFETRQLIDFGTGRDINGIVGIGGTMKFFIVAVKEPSRTGMVLYTTTDGDNWSKATFPHDANHADETAYTILESTDYTILVDVLARPGDASSTLYRSNSEGKYFTKSLEHVNRNERGIVDYEKVQNIEGVMIANTIENWMEVDNNWGITKNLQSRITFNDGATWQPLRAPERDVDGNQFNCPVNDLEKCALHLYGVTSPHNYGRVFSSPAPGILMGVGNVGPHLLPYDRCDTFLSEDGGLTWKMVHRDAYKYEWADQGSIVVIVNDEEPTDNFIYSTDRGRSWHEQKLGMTIRAHMLTTVLDSTSLKFVLLGTLGRSRGKDESPNYILQLDFSSLKKRICDHANNKDFEKWYSRKTEGGEPDCLMGHKQYYWRRKVDSDCFVNEKFHDPEPMTEICPCTEEDYECEFNFAKDEKGECRPVGPEKIPKGVCRFDGDHFDGSSGYRLIPGNTCDHDAGLQKDKPVRKKCSDVRPPPGNPQAIFHIFEQGLAEYYYFSQSDTILMRTSAGDVFISTDQGEHWGTVLQGQRFTSVIIHAYDHSYAYLISTDKQTFYTKDQGLTFEPLNIPIEPNTFGYPPLDMHPQHPEWLIWLGSTGCETIFSQNCHTVAYYTKNNGQSWEELDTYVKTCTWARDTRFKTNDELIYCQSIAQKEGNQLTLSNDHPQLLVSSTDYFRTRKVHFENILGFATFEEYMMVAEIDGKTRGLIMWSSVDGQNFAKAIFPHGVEIGNHAFTVLESITDSIFLHVTTSELNNKYWGTLFISNSNGTYFSVSEENVNRDAYGFVDFEKMHGIDGIAIVNTVDNAEEAKLGGTKKIRSKLTWNNGAHWDYLQAPLETNDGRAFGCDTSKKDNCSLNLHHYTERYDTRDTFGSTSAVGVMIATGDVGDGLGPKDHADTFLTRDAGHTWKHVKSGNYLWEYGDQGSIIVLVKEKQETDFVLYSLDEGQTWKTYKLLTDGTKYIFSDLATAPMDNARKFMLWGVSSTNPRELVGVFLDFSRLNVRQCVYDPEHPENNDFEKWIPQRGDDHCLFGRQTEFLRRIPESRCYIGKKITDERKIVRNCECSKYDFECNYNHVRGEDGECRLVEGATIPSSLDVCKNGENGYYEMTAYRRLPFSSCQGGAEKDLGAWHPCPGKGYSGWAWTAFILLGVGGAAGLAMLMFSRSRNGIKFGRIRLPDFDSAYGRRTSTRTYEILSSVAAVVLFIPVALYTIGGNVVDRVIGIFSNRRGRNQFSYVDRVGYAQVSTDDDATEVLMDDYEEEEES